ncbi:MAG: LysM peptidoglycan-binding domain-containing protein [Flavobacteriaceae bacterium]
MKRILFLILVFGFLQGKATAQQHIQHTVAKDDTVTSLAKKYGVTPHDIYTLNPDAKKGIQLGTVLLIPNRDKKTVKKDGIYHKVEAKETFFGIAQAYGTTIQAIQQANKTLLENGLQPGLELLIPSGKTVQSSTTVVKNDEIIHIVQPKETVFALTQKYEIPKEELVKYNPNLDYLKDDVVKIGDTIKIPLKKQQEKPETSLFGKTKKDTATALFTGDHDFENLLGKLDNSTRKEVVFMLPFNLSRLDMENSLAVQENLKKSQFLNVTLDFYSGALVAIDSINNLGGNFKITFYDSEETQSSSAVEHLIKTNDFSNVEAVIGPFFQSHSDKVASLLKSEEVLVISPLSKEGKTGNDNLYLAVPPTDVSKKMMLNFLQEKKQNVLAIVDRKKQSSRDFISRNGNGIPFVNFNEEGGLNIEHLKSLLQTGKTNYVILETESSSLVLNVTKMLVNLQSLYDIKLAVLEKTAALESDEIKSEVLAKLNLHYPSSVRENNSDETSSFFTEYKKKNNIFPSQYAIRGFDVTFDVLLRLSQKDSFEKTAKKVASEQIESKFIYTKSPNGGYYNTGVYILYYDEDLTIKEAK